MNTSEFKTKWQPVDGSHADYVCTQLEQAESEFDKLNQRCMELDTTVSNCYRLTSNDIYADPFEVAAAQLSGKVAREMWTRAEEMKAKVGRRCDDFSLQLTKLHNELSAARQAYQQALGLDSDSRIADLAVSTNRRQWESVCKAILGEVRDVEPIAPKGR